jgi:carbonic anhydrase
MSTRPGFTSVNRLVANNQRFAQQYDFGDLAVEPRDRLAIVTCMDSRMDIFQILGMHNGQAHIIRNAGGVVTDDVIRSLCLSQRFLGTRAIMLIHHTDCGLERVDEAQFKAELESELGVKPWWALETFSDPYADVRQSMQRILMTPFVTHKENVRGFVYDVTTGQLREVTLDGSTLDHGGSHMG